VKHLRWTYRQTPHKGISGDNPSTLRKEKKNMKKMKWQEPKLIPMNKAAHGDFLCSPGSSADKECGNGGAAAFCWSGSGAPF